MSIIIGPENIMSSVLNESLKHGIDTISFSTLYVYGRKLQERLNKAKIDAVVKNHSYIAAIDINIGKFKYISINSSPYVQAVKHQNYTDIAIPNIEILSIMKDVASEIKF